MEIYAHTHKHTHIWVCIRSCNGHTYIKISNIYMYLCTYMHVVRVYIHKMKNMYICVYIHIVRAYIHM